MPNTAAIIVQDALAIAKAPGFTAQGGRALNAVLTDLWMHRNLKVNLKTSTIAAAVNSVGPFSLETNYGRTYDLFYLVNGEPFFLNPASPREMDAEVQQPGVSGYPYEWSTDLSGVPTAGYGLLYIYPPSATPLSLTHRYFAKQAEITTPETSSAIPWFEDQDYLVMATAMRVMRLTDDARYPTWVQDCENLLRKHLLTEGDEQQVVKEVQLDPRRFRMGGGGSTKPTKADPW